MCLTAMHAGIVTQPPLERMQERQTFRHIDVNTRLMKLSKYWNRQHKSLYRFMNIFEAKSMINRDENGGLIKFTKR